VCTKQVLLSFIDIPFVVISKGPIAAFFMNFLYFFSIFLRELFALYGFFQKERIVHVSGGVALRLEEGVEVPERALHELGRGHFIETHLEQDFSEEGPHLQQGVQVPALRDLALSVEIEFLEFCLLPRT
jgi:hypothetical protein